MNRWEPSVIQQVTGIVYSMGKFYRGAAREVPWQIWSKWTWTPVTHLTSRLLGKHRIKRGVYTIDGQKSINSKTTSRHNKSTILAKGWCNIDFGIDGLQELVSFSHGSTLTLLLMPSYPEFLSTHYHLTVKQATLDDMCDFKFPFLKKQNFDFQVFGILFSALLTLVASSFPQ